jgi:putative ubiquitin-RnfH superfamily antitoxin RatB of RatAB toxin-antitoxin module
MAPADAVAASTELLIELLWSPAPGELQQLQLQLPAGSTLGDALSASQCFDPAQLAQLKVGIWGRLKPLGTPLRAGDRVEVYRGLTVDPKEARRQRYQASGQRIVTRHRPLGRKA